MGDDHAKMAAALRSFYNTHAPETKDAARKVDELMSTYTVSQIAISLHKKYQKVPAGWEEEFRIGKQEGGGGGSAVLVFIRFLTLSGVIGLLSILAAVSKTTNAAALSQATAASASATASLAVAEWMASSMVLTLDGHVRQSN